MIGCSPLYSDKNALWRVEIMRPNYDFPELSASMQVPDFDGYELYYGDLVILRHVVSGVVLHMSETDKS